MRSQWIGRGLVGLAAGAVLAAGVTVVGFAPAESAESAESITSPAPPVSVIAPTTTVAAPVVDTSPAPAPEARPAPTTTRAAAPSSSTTRSTPRSRAPKTDCAAAAMRAGRFDPSCEQYQGYLDPGTVAGRGPTSGEIQREYGCEQGWIPASEC